MSSPVNGDDGGFLLQRARPERSATGPACGGRFGGAAVLPPCPLTVPLLCPYCWSRLQIERPHQIQRRLAQAHLTHRRPQVDHVAPLATAAVEAAEHALAQVHGERPPSAVAPVDRAGAPPLRTTSAQPPRQPQVIQDLLGIHSPPARPPLLSCVDYEATGESTSCVFSVQGSFAGPHPARHEHDRKGSPPPRRA